MTSWFVSDIHLKDLHERNGNTLLRFLFYLKQNPKEHRLFLLGDIFDAWVSDGPAFVNHFRMLIDEIVKFKKAGGEVYYFEGNHDVHVDVFWTKQFNIPVIEEMQYFELHGILQEAWSTQLLGVVENPSIEDRKHLQDEIVHPTLSWKERKELFVKRFARVRSFLEPAQRLLGIQQAGRPASGYIDSLRRARDDSLDDTGGVGPDVPEGKGVHATMCDNHTDYSALLIMGLDPVLKDKVLSDPRLASAGNQFDKIAEIAIKVEQEMASTRAFGLEVSAGAFSPRAGLGNRAPSARSPTRDYPVYQRNGRSCCPPVARLGATQRT